MRAVILGAGAIGGVIGARLLQSGVEVLLVTRGDHASAIQKNGLRLETPDGTSTVPTPVATDIGSVKFLADDIVVLATKSQDTKAMVEALAAVAAPSTPVVCAQNGVENERVALRYFNNVYGGWVWCPTARLLPGVVRAYSSPTPGRIDVGRYPEGVDDTALTVAKMLSDAGFASAADVHVMRLKYAKLLTNLGNAVEAACGKSERFSDLSDGAMEEGIACCRAAGIEFASDDEMRSRINGIVVNRTVNGDEHPGGSTWQSLEIGAASVETDFLNGEISLLGRILGLPTPINDVLQATVRTMVRERLRPGAFAREQIWARVERAGA
jgi:2-dehydropantoate 2-reductase